MAVIDVYATAGTFTDKHQLVAGTMYAHTWGPAGDGVTASTRRPRLGPAGLAAGVGNVDDRNDGPEHSDQDQLPGAHRAGSRHHRSMQRPQID
jgi:hypothetical protein